MSLTEEREQPPAAQVLRRIGANLRLVAASRVLHGVLNIAALAMLARVTDPHEFGAVVLVQAYVLALRAVINVRTAALVVRFGTPLLLRHDRYNLVALLRMSRRWESASAVIAALCAVIGAPLMADAMGWQSADWRPVAAFGAALLLSGTGTAAGYLQLTDRIQLLTPHVLAGPAIRCLGVLPGFVFQLPLHWFTAVWALSLAGEYLVLNVIGHLQMRRDGVLTRTRPGIDAGQSVGALDAPAPIKDVRRFAAANWLQSVLDMVPQRYGTLLAGSLFGNEAGGFYRLASECGTVLSRPTAFLRVTVFPDLARLAVSAPSQLPALLWKLCALTSAAGLTVVTIGFFTADWLIRTVFGAAYVVAVPLLLWLLAANAVELGLAAMRPAGHAMDITGQLVVWQILGICLFGAAALPLMNTIGIEGAGMAMLIGSVTAAIGSGWSVCRAALRS